MTAALRTISLCALVLGAPSAFADDTKVEVVAEAVHAHNNGKAMEPPSMSKLKLQSRRGSPFTSVKRLSQSKLSVTKAKPAEFSLPDGGKATISLAGIKDGVASFDVAIVLKNGTPAKVKYDAGKDPLTVATGEFNGGTLFLVLSPPDGSKPRKFSLRPASRPGVKAERASQPITPR